MQVYVAYYEHAYGMDTRVFSKPEDAEKWRQEIAGEWWDQEMPDDISSPADPETLADSYFDHMGERMSGGGEFFKVCACEVEGVEAETGDAKAALA